MHSMSLNAELRTETGKNANNRLRQKGYIPAVLYSHGESKVIQIKKKEFFNAVKSGWAKEKKGGKSEEVKEAEDMVDMLLDGTYKQIKEAEHKVDEYLNSI